MEAPALRSQWDSGEGGGNRTRGIFGSERNRNRDVRGSAGIAGFGNGGRYPGSACVSSRAGVSRTGAAGEDSGTLILRVVINQLAEVRDAQVVSAHPMLAPAAVEAVKKWRNIPYESAGKTVETQTEVRVIFALAGT